MTTATEKFVSIENVGMEFDTKRARFEALKNLNVTVEQGKFISLIGHSACGKSTLLRSHAKGARFCRPDARGTKTS